MPVVKFFVNDVKRQLHKAEISREGNRAIDQAKIRVPPETPVCTSDRITYVQDMVDLCSNRLLFNFCQHIKDESGYAHHPIGHADFPSPCSFWDFQNIICDTGKDQNTTTVMCGCATFAAGKVRDIGCSDRAFSFDGTRYLTVSNANCDYSFRKDTKWTMATWVYFGTSAATKFIMGKTDDIVAAPGIGMLTNACTNPIIRMRTCADFEAVGTSTIALCMWTHLAATFGGQSDRSCLKLYVNGELCVTGTAGAITSTVANCDCFSMGAEGDGGLILASGSRMDGTYTFTKELTICEIKSLYYEGSIEYVTGLWDGQAIQFDGETGHTTIIDKAPACPRPCNIKLQLKFECNLTDSSGTNCCISMGVGCEVYTCGMINHTH